MARERGGRRRAEEEAPPVMEPVETPGAGAEGARSRPARTPTGPSFALPVAAVSGFGAALLAFLGALLVARTSGGDGDAFEALDKGGIQAARMLAAADIDRWRQDFGTTKAARDRFEKFRTSKLAAVTDTREKGALEAAFDAWRRGTPKPGAEFRPGFDLIFPPADANDDLVEASRVQALKRVAETAPDALVGAAIFDASDNSIVGWGERGVTKGTPSKTVGQTEVFPVTSGNRLLRVYVHPMRDRNGAPAGKARVFLSAASVAGADGGSTAMAAAGAAAGAAFLGAFGLALMLCLGPVKAMRKLASDTEALARGEFGTRVTVSGPDVVQAAAKNVQRLGAVAAAGATAQAVPQVIEQQVIVQPVQEVQEGLAPLKGFRRPDEFEIEATQKICPDLGNDYFETVNVDDERVGLLVADIPNLRGVRGALYMAQVRSLFRAFAPGEPSPAEVLKKVNRAFAQDLPRGVYVTAMYCVVERSTGLCRAASAQHLPLVFWKMSKKASARVQPEGIALGLDPGAVFDKTIAEKRLEIERGDRIVLTTDGAIAAKNPAGAQYGEERFYYVLNREAPKNSAACVNLVANDMDLFHEGAPQTDDFTIVTLRRVK